MPWESVVPLGQFLPVRLQIRSIRDHRLPKARHVLAHRKLSCLRARVRVRRQIPLPIEAAALQHFVRSLSPLVALCIRAGRQVRQFLEDRLLLCQRRRQSQVATRTCRKRRWQATHCHRRTVLVRNSRRTDIGEPPSKPSVAQGRATACPGRASQASSWMPPRLARSQSHTGSMFLVLEKS